MSENSLQYRLSDSESSWSCRERPEVFSNSFSGHRSIEDELINVKILSQAWEKAKSKSRDKSKEAIAKYCYTLENPNFYKTLNSKLREVYKRRENGNFPFKNYVALLSSQVVHFGHSKTLYRGISAFTQPIGREGQYIYSDQFESCSLLDKKARGFAGNGTLFIVSTTMAIDIGKNSAFPDEYEYVIPPGVWFKVDQVRLGNRERMYHEIYITILDKMIIRNIKSGLVLDMSQGIVSIQRYSGKVSQLWNIQGNVIRSKQNGYLLDIAGPSQTGSPIITYPPHAGDNQQWFINTDNTISSGKRDLVLDVREGQLVAGAALCAYPKHGGDNQKFTIIYV